MKSKFKGLNFDSVEVLSREQKKKVMGGGYTNVPKGGWTCSMRSLIMFKTYSDCVSACGNQIFTINNCYYV